jgi:hypothetical protein
MRKKCPQCGLICFPANEVCQRCGSQTLIESVAGDDKPLEREVIEEKTVPFWAYLIFFVLAVLIEFLALMPALANLGMRHSANAAVSDSERRAQFWIFILHLPSALLPWMCSQISEVFSIFYLLVPFAQIIFWTWFLAFLWKRLAGFMKS